MADGPPLCARFSRYDWLMTLVSNDPLTPPVHGGKFLFCKKGAGRFPRPDSIIPRVAAHPRRCIRALADNRRVWLWPGKEVFRRTRSAIFVDLLSLG